nr:sodium ion-translocating decarboxylase subunit beta [Treponemataceae bacterium]
MLENKKSKRHVINVTMAVMAVALVYSVMSTAFASTDDTRRPSLANLDVDIAGSENVPLVSLDEFLSNTVENTGINAIVNGYEEVPDLVDPTKSDIVPGW